MAPHADPEEHDTPLNPGDVIDRKYKVICKIGQGRMGVVYRARSLSLKRDAALKMLTHANPEALEGFRRTAATMGQISHRAVVRIDDFGTAGKWGPYLAMAYVPGTDLATFANTHEVSVEQAVDLTLAICSGVSACHLQSIVHRDIKPGNVRVTQNGEWQDRVKILDFGLALPVALPATADRGEGRGVAPEALRYLAPELLRNGPASRACDQYAIASLLYLLLAGRAPFHGLAGHELTCAILEGAYPALQIVRPGIPVALKSAVGRALSVDPGLRFPSVDDFALAILREASPTLQRLWTRYFANAKRPVDRRLIEPVSAGQPSVLPDHAAGIARITSPMTAVPPERPAVADPTANPVPRTSVVRPPRTPAPLPQAPAHKPIDLNLLLVFSWGVALGAALATGAFIALLSYQRHEASFPTTVPPVGEHRATP